MGPRSALALTATAAALLLSPAPATAAAQPPAQAPVPAPPRAPLPQPPTGPLGPLAPRCGDPGAGGFPVATALRGDGAALRAGSARHSLTLRLHNTSDRPCRGVHPVAVFSHEDGARLLPGDIRLRFYDAGARRWRSVAFERTGADENAGAFARGFRGFALPAGGGRDVPVRLGFAKDAPGGRVTVNVTTVQRRGDDGEWIGQSEDYEVRIEPGTSCCGGTASPGRPESSERPAPPRTTTPREGATPERPQRRPAEPGTPPTPRGTGERGRPGAPDVPAPPNAPTGPAAPDAPTVPGRPDAPAAPGGGAVPRWPDDVPQPPPRLPGAAPMPESLADTGPRPTAAATAGAAASLLLGTALLHASRRLRRDHPAPRTPPGPPPR